MKEKKERSRKSAKEVDYNLMLLRAQKLQAGAECQSLGWGLLELGRSGEAVGGCRLAVFFGEGTCPKQDATRGMCRHDLLSAGWAAQLHRASACLAREASTLWDPEQCRAGGQLPPSPRLCPPHEWPLGRKGSER